MRIELSSTLPPTYQRRGRQWPWIGVVAVIAITAIATSVASWIGVPLPLAAGGALVLMALIWLPEHTWRQTRRGLRDRSPVARQWVITDDEIRVVGGGSSRAWRWSAVVAVDEHRDQYFLRQDGGAILDVPRRALTPGQDGEMRAFLMQRGLLRPTSPTNRAV